MQTFGGGEFDESGQVEAAVQTEAAGPRLVKVPGDVGLDGVEPHEAGLAQPVRPLLGVDAEVVQPAGQESERLAIESEAAVVDLEMRHVRDAPVLGVGCAVVGEEEPDLTMFT